MDRTDHPPQQPTPSVALHTLLHRMADHLVQDPDHAPDAPFAPADRIALAKDIAGNDAGTLLDIAPRIATATTRGAYATRLRQIAGVR